VVDGNTPHAEAAGRATAWAEMNAFLGGGDTASDDDWGGNPYPQFYYDISAGQAVLDFARTSKSGLRDNLAAAVGGIGEFLAFFPR